MATLTGRVKRVETRMSARRGPDHCRACGLRHVRPLTLALIRDALRLTGVAAPAPSAGPLCLCAPCCGETGDRWLARLSHGLPADEDAA